MGIDIHKSMLYIQRPNIANIVLCLVMYIIILLAIPVLVTSTTISIKATFLDEAGGRKGYSYGHSRQGIPPLARSPVTWEDCVDFHFEDCAGKDTDETVFFKADEKTCLNQCIIGSGQGRCLSMITDMFGRSEEKMCYHSPNSDLATLVSKSCNIKWGAIRHKFKRDLEGCITQGDIKCQRGYCNYDHVEPIKDGISYQNTELECHAHCKGAHGQKYDCSHYRYHQSYRVCSIFKLKDPWHHETNYVCKAYAMRLDQNGDFNKDELRACKAGGQQEINTPQPPTPPNNPQPPPGKEVAKVNLTGSAVFSLFKVADGFQVKDAAIHVKGQAVGDNGQQLNLGDLINGP